MINDQLNEVLKRMWFLAEKRQPLDIEELAFWNGNLHTIQTYYADNAALWIKKSLLNTASMPIRSLTTVYRRQVKVTKVVMETSSPHDFVPEEFLLPGTRLITHDGVGVTIMEKLDSCTHCGVDGSYIELVLDKDLQERDLLLLNFPHFFREEFIVKGIETRSIR